MGREAFVGFWIYLGQERSIGEPRRTNGSVAEHLARSPVGIQQAGTARSDLADQLAYSQKESRQGQAAKSELTQKMAGALPNAQLPYDVSEIGLVSSQGKDSTQEMFAWCGKLTSLDDQTLNRITETIAKDPRNRVASEEYAKYLAGSVRDALR